MIQEIKRQIKTDMNTAASTINVYSSILYRINAANNKLYTLYCLDGKFLGVAKKDGECTAIAIYKDAAAYKQNFPINLM